MSESPPPAGGSGGPLGWVLDRAASIGIFLTFLGTVINGTLTYHNKTLLDQTEHAEKFAAAFQSNFATITAFMHSNVRVDEQAADMSLTALDDAAESSDDRIAMLTIGARLLNATDCPSSGEATARFLSIIVTQIRLGRYPESEKLMAFVRSHAFLDLASDDISTRYNNDDPNASSVCGSTTTIAERQTGVTPLPAGAIAPVPTPTVSPSPQPPMFTPLAGDPRNHATLWGEQAAWNDAKNELFRLLRPDDFDGWIHIATWEEADRCVDETGRRRPAAACTPIRIHYTSTPFAFRRDDPGNAATPFWLGRARFLRDASPRYYRHEDDSAMQYRGALGRVIGVVDDGECVRPRARPTYVEAETSDRLRRFVHVWLEVGPANRTDCKDLPDEPPPLTSGTTH